jgi:fructokinase
MGGGVMATPGLIDLVKAEADALAKGYFAARASEIIVPPGLGDDAGLMGAFALSLTSGRSA